MTQPLSISENQGYELVERWHATFHHSAGRLGSQFLSAIRDERKILGWRTGDPPRVIVPPKDIGGEGVFVAVGPGGRLLAYAPNEWLGASACESVLGLVALDAADTPLLARIQAGPVALSLGMRLTAAFAETRTGIAADLWFVPA